MILRAMLWPVRFLLGLTKSTLALLAVFALMLNLATGMMAVAFAPVAKIFTTMVDTVSGGRSLQRQTRAEMDGLRRQHAQAMTDLRASHQTELAARDTRITQLSDETLQLRRANTVTYRGQAMVRAEVIEDTTRRLRTRVTRASVRNIASMPGEAIPIFGIGVIAGATAWEINDTCELMNDLYEMEIAFNPENAVPPDRTEACGLQVPTKEELWQMIKNSPGAIWAEMKDLYADLPDFAEGAYNWTVRPVLAGWDYLFGDDT